MRRANPDDAKALTDAEIDALRRRLNKLRRKHGEPELDYAERDRIRAAFTRGYVAARRGAFWTHDCTSDDRASGRCDCEEQVYE